MFLYCSNNIKLFGFPSSTWLTRRRRDRVYELGLTENSSNIDKPKKETLSIKLKCFIRVRA